MSNPLRVPLTDRRGIAGERTISQLFWIIGTAAVTALAARLEIPHDPVPFTLQTLVVLLAGALLGPVNGALSQVAYLAAGLAGLPVFAGGTAGIARLIGPSGGYLMAFPLAAAVIGLFLERRSGLIRSFGAMTLGLLIIFFLGTLHLYVFYLHNLVAALGAGFLIFGWWDLLKLAAAAMLYYGYARKWRQEEGTH